MNNLTVVIPAFNHAEYLGDAIDSVRSSVGVRAEIVVVDDGSTDASSQVALARGADVVLTQENGGAHAAINVGIAAASCEVLAILNDDDEYLPDYLKRVHGLLSRYEAGVVLSSPTPIGSGPLFQRMAVHMEHSGRTVTRYGASVGLLRTNWFVGSSGIATTRSAWAELGGFRDYRLAHDLDFALRALANERIHVFRGRDGLWLYRCHGTNTVSTIGHEVTMRELGVVRADFDAVLEATGLWDSTR